MPSSGHSKGTRQRNGLGKGTWEAPRWNGLLQGLRKEAAPEGSVRYGLVVTKTAGCDMAGIGSAAITVETVV
jgi:hypothetical protein